MAALTTLNITEKNDNNSLSVTVKVNVTKEGMFITTLSKENGKRWGLLFLCVLDQTI